MQPSLLLPLLGSSTKSTILQVLTEKQDLTLKELNFEVNKYLKKPITYQALHKAVTEMLTDEILLKIGKKIGINPAWTEKIVSLTNTLKNSHEESRTTQSKPSAQEYTFESFLDVAKFMCKYLAEMKVDKSSVGVCIWRHAWPLFGVNKKDYEYLGTILRDNQFYDLIKSKTPLDKTFAKTFETLGKKVIVGSKLTSPCDIFVKGDTIVKIFFTNEFEQMFDKLFKQHISIEELPINKLIEEFVVKKTSIKLLAFKDCEYANKLRKEALTEFEEIKENKI